MFLMFSPLLVWMSGYLLVSLLLREWQGWKKALLVSAFYLTLGAILIAAAANVSGFVGAPPFFALIWPVGYVFVLFGERLFNVSELYRLLWMGLGMILGLGLVSAGLIWFGQRIGGSRTPG